MTDSFKVFTKDFLIDYPIEDVRYRVAHHIEIFEVRPSHMIEFGTRSLNKELRKEYKDIYNY